MQDLIPGLRITPWAEGKRLIAEPPRVPLVYFILFYLFFLKILFIYLFMRQREAETQAEGEAGSMQGAQCRT